MQLNEKFGQLVASRPLQYLLIGLAISGVLYWYWFGRGKQQGKKVPVKYPTGTDTVAEVWMANQGRSAVTALYEAINGVSLDDTRKAAAMAPLLAMTDAQLKWILSEYTKRYSQNLIPAIEDEYMGLEQDLRSKVLYRLKNLKTTA